MWDDDEIPGEELSLQVIIRKTEEGDEYWAYLGNHGGSGWTVKWAEKFLMILQFILHMTTSIMMMDGKVGIY